VGPRAWLEQHPWTSIGLWFLLTFLASAAAAPKNEAAWKELRKRHPRAYGWLQLLQGFGAAAPMILNGLSLVLLGRPLFLPPTKNGGESREDPPPPSTPRTRR
jgi:hypothetical protein